MKKVAVLGGGPAGSFAAERLARAGLDTVIFDEKLAWEKPCGGGLTYKAYDTYSFLLQNGSTKKIVTDAVLSAPKAGSARMKLAQPLVIYARKDLNGMLLKRAEAAGAQVEATRVTGVERSGNGWSLKTKGGAADADFLVVATGARNPLRNVGTEWTARDTMYALGYYVPAEREEIDIQFLAGLEGYIWVFPRAGHLSVGICGKGESAQALRARLERYMVEHDLSTANATFYAHALPSLENPSWRNNRVAGDGWLAAGDAAGLVDPVTGEGLYYAMRSGDLASQVLLRDADPATHAATYRHTLQHDFMADLEFGASLAKRVFVGSFLFSTVPNRMVEFMRQSPRFMNLMQDLFAGTQPYLGLKTRLWRNLNGTLREIVMNWFLHRMIPSEESV